MNYTNSNHNMHIQTKYSLQDLWIKNPEKVRLYMSVEKFTRINDELNGLIDIQGKLYKIIGDDQACGMITMRVELLF
jgi:hypothetical protein